MEVDPLSEEGSVGLPCPCHRPEASSEEAEAVSSGAHHHPRPLPFLRDLLLSTLVHRRPVDSSEVVVEVEGDSLEDEGASRKVLSCLMVLRRRE